MHVLDDSYLDDLMTFNFLINLYKNTKNLEGIIKAIYSDHRRLPN